MTSEPKLVDREAGPDFYVGLLHYPVINRAKEVVTSSVTNLDIHDIARSSKTFGVKGYYVIHPSEDQQALNQRIIRHWQGRYGTDLNPTRKAALELVRLRYHFEEAVHEITSECQGAKPLLVGTHARPKEGKEVSLDELRRTLKERPVFLLFGTAYGLEPSWDSRLDAYLPPIRGPVPFNHLSVRSAASIYLDRLFGQI